MCATSSFPQLRGVAHEKHKSQVKLSYNVRSYLKGKKEGKKEGRKKGRKVDQVGEIEAHCNFLSRKTSL